VDLAGGGKKKLSRCSSTPKEGTPAHPALGELDLWEGFVPRETMDRRSSAPEGEKEEKGQRRHLPGRERSLFLFLTGGKKGFKGRKGTRTPYMPSLPSAKRGRGGLVLEKKNSRREETRRFPGWNGKGTPGLLLGFRDRGRREKKGSSILFPYLRKKKGELTGIRGNGKEKGVWNCTPKEKKRSP